MYKDEDVTQAALYLSQGDFAKAAELIEEMNYECCGCSWAAELAFQLSEKDGLNEKGRS